MTTPVGTAFESALDEALRADRVRLPRPQLARFARELLRSKRLRERGPKRLATPARDIFAWIDHVRSPQPTNEIVWRLFLAAHFGRMSASHSDGTAESAGLLLCGFGDAVMWTWETVREDAGAALELWLNAHPRISDVLRFGNHRKYESPSTAALMEVIRSFIDYSELFNGAANTIKAPGVSSPFERFDVLFRHIKIRRFDRLGKWDLIDVLGLFGLTDAEPEHCYLKGARGPLVGARQIWGAKNEDALDALTAALARRLGLSCFVLEDALCNFPKDTEDSCCRDPDDDGDCPG